MSNHDNDVAERARLAFAYDNLTGVLYWAKPTSNSVRVGNIAGYKDNAGYIQVRFEGKRYLAHRLIWLIYNGKWPSMVIDHKDGNKSNNLLSNLRDVSLCSNSQNRLKPSKLNKSGFIGVSWRGDKSKWQACIKINSKQTHLGYFETPELAHKAYIDKKLEVHDMCASPFTRLQTRSTS
jgi:HNH endonuclease/AP2 domain